MSDTLSWATNVDTKAQVEHDRLTLLQEVFDPFSARLLDRVGVAAEWQCLEVGAGAGSVARMLADRAGAANVTATDMSIDFLEPLEATGIRVLHHDVTVDEPPGEFDLIHSRFVLEHVTGRDEALRRMASWLRPGGWLVVESATPTPELSSEPAVGRALSALARLMARLVGTDPVWARRLPVALEEAGLTDCDAEGHVVPARGGSPMARWLVATHRVIEEPALASGAVTADELAAAYAAYANPSFVDHTWLTIGALGRRPT
ncbi:class I SAM-dependent methyltransferase [Actinophytocola sp.]|uniref:class I SAM-dependent methyltransferase n=1 Tax=Actinophytocola sp. TaxID=1872138 RepID=UPI003D6B6A7B